MAASAVTATLGHWVDASVILAVVLLNAVIGFVQEGNKVTAMKCIRMELGEPDDSGRRRPLPIEGDTYELPLETMITAVSQKPDLAAMKSKELGDGWLNGDDWGFTGVDGIWTGGDNINLGIATTSIGQASKAAEAIHAHLQGETLKEVNGGEMIRADKLKIDRYTSLIF